MRGLGRLLPVVGRYGGRVLLGFAAFFAARFFEVSSYYLVAQGVDEIGRQLQGAAGPYSIGAITLGILGAVLARFVSVTYARRGIRRVGQAVAFDLRQRLYKAVQRQGAGFLARLGIGDIMTRAIQDIALVQRLIASGLIAVVIMVYAPLFGVGAMLLKSAELTLYILPLLPIIFLYARHSAREMGRSSRAVQERLSELASHTQENLAGIRTVQALAQEAQETQRFLATNNRYAAAFYDQARVNSAMSAWMPFFASAAQLVILLYGGHLVLQGLMSVGDLVFFFACLGMLLQPIRMAGMLVMMVQRAAVAVGRLFEIYDAAPEILDAPSGAAPSAIRGGFALRGLGFAYPGASAPALAGLSLDIAPGESIGIVGRIGSGKTTLLRLFTRMLDTPRGQLFIDGHDVCDYPVAQLRSQLALVLQDPYLFGEPLGSNISYDDPERQPDLIWDAAESASLKESIEVFPQQLATLVGERGLTLSGGQRQRAALARGLIRDAPVLLLDDCFSAVDTETEEQILRRLKARRAGKTTLLVSHRVSTLRHADRILVLEAGRLAELGSHEELLAKGGVYAELERIQTLGETARQALADEAGMAAPAAGAI